MCTLINMVVAPVCYSYFSTEEERARGGFVASHLAPVDLEQVERHGADRTIAAIEVPPFTMLHNGAPAGLLPDLIAELDRRIGGRTRMILVSVNRLRKLLETGAVDFAFLPTGLVESKTGLMPLARVADVGLTLWPRKGISIRHYSDMQGLVYASLRNGYFSQLFDTEPLMEYAPIDHFWQAAQLLKGGRVDAVAGAATALLYSFDKGAIDPADLGGAYVLEVSEVWLYLVPGKQRKSVDDKLVTELEKMYREGRYLHHRNAYVEAARLPKFTPKN